MGELMPCPFCGHAAKTATILTTTVCCSHCKARGPLMPTGEHTFETARDHDTVTAWNTRPRTEGRGEGDNRFWLVLHEPGRVPERKGPWNQGNGEIKRVLREFMAARPTAYIDVLTLHHDGPDVQHGPELLQMLDGRSMARGSRHNAQTGEAHATHHAALASPIREPEISRTKRGEIEKLLRENLPATCGLHCQREQTQEEEDAAYRYTADAILNLAPVGGRGEESQALADVAAERRRQMEVEGWTPEHDDSHGGDLLTAAVCYAQRRMDEDRFGVFSSYAPAAWPWDASWWKPKDRRRDLIRAAALLVAEIERLDRLPLPPQEQGGMK